MTLKMKGDTKTNDNERLLILTRTGQVGGVIILPPPHTLKTIENSFEKPF